MSVLSFGVGDLFRFTVVKYLSTNPDRKWGNNYEAKSKIDGVLTDLTALGVRLVDFEKAIHFTPVQFDRLRISTWEPDSVPYDPTSFVSLPLSGAGEADLTTEELVALNVCWDVARVPLSGRFGHIYFRGCLTESRVTAPAGKFILDDPAGMDTILANAIDDSSLAEYVDGTSVNFDVCMIDATGSQVRSLAGLTSRGVAVVPFDHAWFNRTTGA